MKHTLYILGAMLAGSLALTSCENYLTAENKTAGGNTAEEYFSTDPSSLATYAYSKMKPIVSTIAIYEYGTDLYTPTRGKKSDFDLYAITSEEGDIKSFYSNLYSCINMANACIHYEEIAGVSKHTAEMRFVRSYCYYLLTQHFGAVPYVQEYINSAKRDYPRTELKAIYDGILTDLDAAIAADNLSDASTDGRASKQACKALACKVALAAGWDLETEYTDVKAGTFSKKGSEYFKKAIAYGEQLVNPTCLTLSFAEKWNPATADNCAENFFAVQYDRDGYPGVASEGGHGLQNTFGCYFGSPSTGQKYTNSEFAMSEKAMRLWSKGDDRQEATFMRINLNAPGSDDWGTKGYYAAYGSNADACDICWVFFPFYVTEAEIQAFATANAARLQKHDNVNDPHIYRIGTENSTDFVMWNIAEDGALTGKKVTAYKDQIDNGLNFLPCVKKWDDVTSTFVDGTNTSNDYRDITILHASDIMLCVAEAYLLAGNDAKALEYINAIRTRANAGALASVSAYEPDYTVSTTFENTELAMLDLLLDERGRELYAENERWMDLRRTKQLVRYNAEFNRYYMENQMFNGADAKILRPIPQAEINANDALNAEDQNKGY